MRHSLRKRYGRAKVAGVSGCRKALKELLEYAVGNRGSREGNPWMKPQVQAAAIALGEGEDWMKGGR